MYQSLYVVTYSFRLPVSFLKLKTCDLNFESMPNRNVSTSHWINTFPAFDRQASRLNHLKHKVVRGNSLNELIIGIQMYIEDTTCYLEKRTNEAEEYS